MKSKKFWEMQEEYKNKNEKKREGFEGKKKESSFLMKVERTTGRKNANQHLFHNPYHFVPVETPKRMDDLSEDLFIQGKAGHVTHDRYTPETFSGRVICRLTTKSPMFVGNERTEKATTGNPAEVAPFELPDTPGKPAIPASSLRGLISSIAEAASNSAMRVLKNRCYSYRADYKTESLGALGIIVEETNIHGKKCGNCGL